MKYLIKFKNNLEAIMNEEITLTDLFDVEMLQRIQDAFSKMTGLGALITDANGKAVDVQWVSSDASCTVNGNTITRVSADNYTEITAQYQGQTFTCKLYTR